MSVPPVSQAETPNGAAAKMSVKTKLQWCVTFGIPLAIALIPPNPVFTKQMLSFLAVTVWAVLSWMFGIIPELVVGFLLPVLYIIVGAATPQDAFSPWVTNVPWISFGGILLGRAMMSTGLAKRIAYRAILLTGGTYRRTLAGLMLGGLIIAPLVPSIIGKAAIFSVIGIAICQALNLPPLSRGATGVMMTAFLAVAGPKLSYLTAAGDNPLAMGLVAKVTGTMITWGEFALHNAVIGILYSFLGLAIVFFTIKPEKEFDSVEVIKARYAELGPIVGVEKRTAILLAVTFVLMITDFLHKIDVGWIMVVAAGLLFVPGVSVLKPEQLGKINVFVVFFVAGAMCIGPVAAKIGVVKVMAGYLLPLLKGSTLYTFISVYFFGVVLKFFLTPLAATAMFITTITEIALQLGLHPYSLVYVFKYGIDQYIFPYEYAVLLYVYSFGYFSLQSVFKVMIPRIFVTGVFLVLVAYPYWKLCGLF